MQKQTRSDWAVALLLAGCGGQVNVLVGWPSDERNPSWAVAAPAL